MNQYTVDLTPDRGRLDTWHVDETLAVMMPIMTPNGLKMVAVSPDSSMGMNLIPALLTMGGTAFFSPDRVDLVEQLFAREFGPTTTALAPAKPRQMSIYGGDGRAAKTGAMIVQAGLRSAGARVKQVREEIRENSLYGALQKTPPMHTFHATVLGTQGAAVTFVGDATIVPAYRGVMRTAQLNPADPAGFLNAPWQQTDAAPWLVRIAQQINFVQAESIKCTTTNQRRASCQAQACMLLGEADRLAQEFLNDTMPRWMPRGQGTPSVVPGQENIWEVGRLIQADRLPQPENTVGGCHRLAG